MSDEWPWVAWDEYVVYYNNSDDGVHIRHVECDTDVAEPEFELPIAKAVVMVEEHSAQCTKRPQSPRFRWNQG